MRTLKNNNVSGVFTTMLARDFNIFFICIFKLLMSLIYMAYIII